MLVLLVRALGFHFNNNSFVGNVYLYVCFFFFRRENIFTYNVDILVQVFGLTVIECRDYRISNTAGRPENGFFFTLSTTIYIDGINVIFWWRSRDNVRRGTKGLLCYIHAFDIQWFGNLQLCSVGNCKKDSKTHPKFLLN